MVTLIAKISLFSTSVCSCCQTKATLLEASKDGARTRPHVDHSRREVDGELKTAGITKFYEGLLKLWEVAECDDSCASPTLLLVLVGPEVGIGRICNKIALALDDRRRDRSDEHGT